MSTAQRSEAQVEPAGLDLGQVEDVVDEAEQVPAAAVDVARDSIGRHAGRRRPACSCAHQLEKPMIAFSGVRSSWLMLARKSLLRLAGPGECVDGVAELGGQPPLCGRHRLPFGEDAGLAAEGREQPQVVVAEQAAVPVEQQHRALDVRRHRHAEHGHEVVAQVVAEVLDQRRLALTEPGGRPARTSAVRSAKPSRRAWASTGRRTRRARAGRRRAASAPRRRRRRSATRMISA